MNQSSFVGGRPAFVLPDSDPSPDRWLWGLSELLCLCSTLCGSLGGCWPTVMFTGCLFGGAARPDGCWLGPQVLSGQGLLLEPPAICR